MGVTKIVNETEVLRWFEEGRTYAWMVEEYKRKYGIDTVNSMWSNFRHRRGLERRIVRDDVLIPWHVEEKHRWDYAVQMLRSEARRRDGRSLRPQEAERLQGWLRTLKRERVVVAYDATVGFTLVPRLPSDTDIIRIPARKSTLRRNASR